MFSSIRIAMILVLLAGAGGAFLYVKNLQKNLEIARANVAKLEVAVQTSEASLKLERAESARLGELNNQLSTDLQKAEQYGDELRATLQKHNLTHLANKKPGLIEKRMQNATNKLWDDLESITDPNANAGVQSTQDGSADSNSN
jgi:Skp family chaperone for outer membrane proteins